MDTTKPSLLVIDQVTSPTARAFPVDDLCRLARERGVLTLVDGAHAPGVFSDPVCREADYWVANLHKFACAPRGAAVLVARDPGPELCPSIDSWGARLPYPDRFDHTGTLDTTAWLAAPFAWRHIEQTAGWDYFRSHASALASDGAELVARAFGTEVPDVGQPVGPLRLVGLPEGLGSSREIADAMRIAFAEQTDIAVSFTSFRGEGFLRLSGHLYNTIHDYEYLASMGTPLLRRWSQDLMRGTG